MEFNLEKLLMDVFDPQKGETVLVMYDVPNKIKDISNEWGDRIKMAQEWRRAFKKLGEQIGFYVYPLLSYSATMAHGALLPKYGRTEGKKVMIEDILAKTNICVALTQYSATASLFKFAKQIKGRLRIASMPRASKDMEKTALSADYKEVARKCSILVPKLTKATGAIIEFSTDDHKFYFDLRNRVAEEDNGMCGRKRAYLDIPGINLPSGEVFSVPYEGEDEKIGPSNTRGFLPVNYNNELVIYEIQQNKIIRVIGKGLKAEEMREYFAKDNGRRNIAELGLGLNDKAILSEITLEAEKVLGFHWAYGLSDHLGGITGMAQFENPENAVHQDNIYAKGGTIEIKKLVFVYPNNSRETIIQNGDYVVF